MMTEERLMTILLEPHISEKAAMGAENAAQHVFKVRTDASKPEIKAAIEKLFNVSVDQVQVMNVKGKTKRFGRSMGRRSDWKKAVVRLASGQDIDYTGGAE